MKFKYEFKDGRSAEMTVIYTSDGERHLVEIRRADTFPEGMYAESCTIRDVENVNRAITACLGALKHAELADFDNGKIALAWHEEETE